MDATDKLEMGLYDLTSSGSMLDFFRRGVMYAALKKLRETTTRQRFVERVRQKRSDEIDDGF